MTRAQLFEQIKSKQSFLCVGLDTDINRIPEFLLKEEDPIFEFNKRIIEATQDLCVAYKPNLAFYESLGSAGIRSLEKTLEVIPDNIFSIADAKRGDIGNTSKMYAKAFFENMGFDSITVSPYMGHDAVTPYFDYKGKWAIILGITSNPGADDLERLKLESGEEVYEKLLATASTWGNPDNTMFVVGATRPELMKKVRQIVPDHFLLVPGVGAQGGDLNSIAEYGMNDHCGLLVNSSRGIIYASNGEDFAERAREEAMKLQRQMAVLLG
jgi:orotidine-5'-phosphate decarboxylase